MLWRVDRHPVARALLALRCSFRAKRCVWEPCSSSSTRLLASDKKSFFPGATKTQTARMQLLSLEVARTILCADAVVLAAAVTGCAAPGTWGCVGTATYAGAAKWREVSS